MTVPSGATSFSHPAPQILVFLLTPYTSVSTFSIGCQIHVEYAPTRVMPAYELSDPLVIIPENLSRHGLALCRQTYRAAPHGIYF